MRRGIWFLNPFDLEGGWHVLVTDGGRKPKRGQVVLVTRKDEMESEQTIVQAVAVFRKLPRLPAVWFLCAVEATKRRPEPIEVSLEELLRQSIEDVEGSR